MTAVSAYRLTPDEMASAAERIGCRFLVPHTTAAFRWTWDGAGPVVMVTNNATDSRWWQNLARQSPAICLIRGRLRWKSALQGQTAFYFGRDPSPSWPSSAGSAGSRLMRMTGAPGRPRHQRDLPPGSRGRCNNRRGRAMTTVTVSAVSNAGVAQRARDVAARSPAGSTDRKAALCLSACLITTSSAAAARKALAEIEQPAIRARAGALLDELQRPCAP